MAMKTRAAVTVGPRKVEMREIPVPETNEDTGLVRIELTGVCGVDWPAFNGSRPDRFKVPLIQGHEIVGRIERIGRKAESLQTAGRGSGDKRMQARVVHLITR